MYPSYPAPSEKALSLESTLRTFMAEEVLPREAEVRNAREAGGSEAHGVPPQLEELKRIARDRGLWNLFLPAESGLTQLEYAPLAEMLGWSELGPESTNSSAPATCGICTPWATNPAPC